MTMESKIPNTSNRYSRQAVNVVLDKIQTTPITIIGVGAVGRELALRLTQMGAEDITLIDFDRVEEPNICTQGYWEEDIGELKVHATAKACQLINSKMSVDTYPVRFAKGMKITPIIFCCVDTMKARKFIWDYVKEKVEYYSDTRMSAEVCRMITLINKADKEFYESTLFSDKEAFEAGCTTRATCYCTSINAGFALANLAKWTRGANNLIEKDWMFNILSNEMIINE